MPLFPGQQDKDGSVWEPQAADRRLAKTAGADPSCVFTSDLSVSEYVLLPCPARPSRRGVPGRAR